MIASDKRRGWAVAAAAVLAGAVAVRAQEGNAGSEAGAVAAVAAELRQLRVAVQESLSRQTQAQALGVYLSAQQARLVQVGARVDAARKELDDLTARSKELGDRLAMTEELGPRSDDPHERKALD